MIFWAKIKFNASRDAEYLIRAFFEDFSNQNLILIEGDKAFIKIISDNTPREIVKALSQCQIEEFNYNGDMKKFEDFEVELIGLEENQSKINLEVPTNQVKSVKSQEIVESQKEEIEKEDEFIELATKASSYDEFIKLVVTWFEMKESAKSTKRFLEVIKSAEIINERGEKITWKNIKNNMEEKVWKRDSIARKISKKYRTLNKQVGTLRTLKVIQRIVEFKNWDFEKNINHQLSVKEDGEKKESKTEIQMKSMPNIPYLEKTVNALDRSKPIEQQLKAVLTEMGWKESYDEEMIIFKITNTAIRMKTVAFHEIFINAEIPVEEEYARMVMSQFINDFVKVYDPTKKLKVMKFLEDLRNIFELVE